LFNFYEYIAILIFREEIDIELFYYYFNTRIIWIYDIFMNSKNIPDFDSRTENYPNLCGLFNSLDLSVKEIKG